MSRPEPAAAPARHLVDHRKARTRQWVEEAPRKCRERALCARVNVSEAVGGIGCPKEPEAS